MADICLRGAARHLSGIHIRVKDFVVYVVISACFQVIFLLLVEAPLPRVGVSARTDPRESEPIDDGVKIVELSGSAYALDKRKLWEKHAFPSPVTNPRKCGREHPSYICDPDGLLTQSEVLVLDGSLRSLCEASECACQGQCPESCRGLILSVLLVSRLPFLHSLNGTSEQQTILAQWSNYLRTKVWNLAKCDDDMLLIISAEDDFQMYLSIGSRVSRDISASCVEQVYHWIKPNLDQDNFADALYMLVQDFRDILSGKHGCQTFPRYMATGTKIGIIYGATCLPIMLCVVAIFMAPCFRGRGRGSKPQTSYTRSLRSPDVTSTTTYKDTTIVLAGPSSAGQPAKL